MNVYEVTFNDGRRTRIQASRYVYPPSTDQFIAFYGPDEGMPAVAVVSGMEVRMVRFVKAVAPPVPKGEVK